VRSEKEHTHTHIHIHTHTYTHTHAHLTHTHVEWHTWRGMARRAISTLVLTHIACVVVRYSVLQCVAVCCSVLQCVLDTARVYYKVLQSAAECCSGVLDTALNQSPHLCLWGSYPMCDTPQTCLIVCVIVLTPWLIAFASMRHLTHLK